MRVIITGGTGLIGRALAKSLIADGYETIVLTRHPQSARQIAGVKFIGWDGKTPQGWGRLIESGTVIVNLAGASIGGATTFKILFQRWTPQIKQQIRDSRRQASAAVVQAIQESGADSGVLIQGSAVGYYGTRNDQPLPEDTPPGMDFLAQTAKQWEISSEPVEAAGWRRAIIRSGIVLSLRGGTFPMLLLPFRFFAGGRLGSGNQWLPWIHLDDEVAAIRFLIDQPQARGPFNLVAPQAIRNAEVARSIGRLMHRPAWLPVPGWALRMLLAEKAMLVLDGQRPAPGRLLGLGFGFAFPQFETALANLLS
jgi:uncharacterized protein (TIGR01777 family)